MQRQFNEGASAAGIAERRFTALSNKKSGFVRRGHVCSAYSIPSLFPENASDTALVAPYQALAARGVNNLASKLMMTLLPPNMSFFKLDVDESKLSEEERSDQKMREEIDKGLGKVERAFLREIAAWSDRVGLFEALEHLLVVGNVLIYLNPDGGIKCYDLASYVVERDGEENPCEIIIKENVNEYDVPDATLAELKSRGNQETAVDAPIKQYEMFTYLRREETKWEIFQEIQGLEVSDSRGTYPLDACPWIPLRLFKASKTAYGRGYIEKYFGDIKSLDGLSQAILEASAASAKIIWMVAPNSTVSEEDLANAPNMGFVVGNRKDVEVLQVEKQADLRVAMEQAQSIRQDLERVFIMNSAIQRAGERVTAEEIRKMIEDLETALGGVYSLLALDFQLPYVSCRLKQLQQSKRIPELPKEVVKPIITTGVTALGRNSDKERIVELLNILKETVGPEGLRYFDMKQIATRLCTAIGVDIDGILTTDNEDAQREQQGMMQQNIEKLGPGAMKLFGDMMKQPMAQGQELSQPQGGTTQP